jgi:hypothetical protein
MADLFTDQESASASGFGCCGSSDFGTKNSISADDTNASDVALAREMNELSVKERENLFDDIHGVAKIQEETPELVRTCLGEMDVALSMVPKAKRKALDRAFFFKPSIQTDVKFKLMFLRADLYDAQKAAKRMAKFYEEKVQLFGEDKLMKKITLDDLEEGDVEKLNYVGCAVLPYKDQVGRPIFFFDIPRFDFDNPESMVRGYCVWYIHLKTVFDPFFLREQYRCNWYQIMATLEDDTAQLKGICDVAYCPGDLLAMPSSISKISKVMMRNGTMIKGLPCRVSTFHFCYNDPRVRYVISSIRSNFGKEVRLRIRSHFGKFLVLLLDFNLPLLPLPLPLPKLTLRTSLSPNRL